MGWAYSPQDTLVDPAAATALFRDAAAHLSGRAGAPGRGPGPRGSEATGCRAVAAGPGRPMSVACDHLLPAAGEGVWGAG
jgi:hypothetical protein